MDVILLVIKNWRYFLSVFILLLGIVILNQILYPPKCPSDFYTYIFKPKDIKGIVVGKSITCVKGLVYIKYLDLTETGITDTVRMDLNKQLICLANDATLGDTIIKKQDQLEFVLYKKNGDVKKYEIKCNNNCDCTNGSF